jgi:tRNA nucleotidyltransferase/poly(A) polymerase
VERNKETTTGSDIELTSEEATAIEFFTRVVSSAETKGFIKGGFLRDKVVSKERGLDLVPKDIDILVVDRINKVAEIAHANGASIVERRKRKGTPVFRFSHQDFPELDIEMGVALGEEYDTATFLEIRRADALMTDLNVNGMSLVLGEPIHTISDPLDARTSIKRGEITLTHRAVLYRNPENVFRAVRIADKIDCELIDWSKDLIRDNAQVVARIQIPFLLAQIRPIVESENAEANWALLTDLGVLQYAFPERTNISLEEIKEMYE